MGSQLMHALWSFRTKSPPQRALSFRTAGISHTALRRIEPNSRTFLVCEQQNPSELVHPEDKMSRHRGSKQYRQWELSDTITLLSLA